MSHVVVTGAASGIGAAVAALAEADGATVARCDRAYTEPIPGHYYVDVADFTSTTTTLAAITADWGRAPDALVHAAGIYRVRPAVDLDGDAWDATLSVNARGSFLMARAVAATMIEAGTGGAMVLLGSVAAMRGDSVEPAAAYAASKGAVSSLVKQLAVEWAPAGIRVNAVMPGVIDTAMTTIVDDEQACAEFLRTLPLGRLGTADEVAAACLFLAGPRASYITGVEIAVDGGYLVS
jgi:NAD(P)-dependent dehydrogenase (short-subunit alcohol dehydrogenase family)